MSAGQQATAHAEQGTFLLSQISNEMVRLYKEGFGRGPNRARTYWAGNDTLTVLLEDTFTPAERNLVRMGQHERLRDSRMFFQYASVRDFCTPIEEITGRKVRAFVSGIDTQAEGLSVETFVLYPKGSGESSRIAGAGARTAARGLD